MEAYNIVVNDVQKTENKVRCLARIDNYKNMLKRVSVGEYITTSEPINIHFHSIGTSKWVLIFYPRGQYICSTSSSIFENGPTSIYLKMLSCENQDNSLTTTIKFFIKSPYFEMKDKFHSTKRATFLHRDVNKRWIGPFNLAPSEELHSKQFEDFFFNDCLTIGCELDVVTFSPRMTLASSEENVDRFHQKSDNIRRSLNQKNDYIRRASTNEEAENAKKEKNPSNRRTRSVFVKNDVEEEEIRPLYGHPQSTESNKKTSNYRSTGNSGQYKETWHQRLLMSSIEGIEANEIKPLTHQVIMGSKLPETKGVLQVSNKNSGYDV